MTFMYSQTDETEKRYQTGYYELTPYFMHSSAQVRNKLGSFCVSYTDTVQSDTK